MLKNSDQEYIQKLLTIANRSQQESDGTKAIGEARSDFNELAPQTAISCYQKILQLQPQRADIYLKLAHLLQEQQQTTEAIDAYQRATTLKPEQPDWVYHNLGDLLAQQQKYEQAIAIFQELIKTNPFKADQFYIKIGDLFHAQNQFFAAKAAYRQASRAIALYNIQEVITLIRQYFITDSHLLNIDILDNGCDHTGRQLALVAEQTQGRVVGTNIYRGFPEQTVKRCRPNNEFYYMDGQNLTFEDNSFDLVISLNVLEHVPNPAKYLQECFRVLRSGGYGYFSWYPVWSGATGHHVHPDMVSRTSQKLGLQPPNYRLDGTSIPYWGHLLFSANEMLSFLVEEKQYHPVLAAWMKDYIYNNHDLNRWFWRDIWRLFPTLNWNLVKVEHRGKKLIDSLTLNQLQRKFGITDDFEICGACIIVRK
jgi:ubiquinone/menaquinone biosynthesis C-methylase UbiE